MSNHSNIAVTQHVRQLKLDGAAQQRVCLQLLPPKGLLTDEDKDTANNICGVLASTSNLKASGVRLIPNSTSDYSGKLEPVIQGQSTEIGKVILSPSMNDPEVDSGTDSDFVAAMVTISTQHSQTESSDILAVQDDSPALNLPQLVSRLSAREKVDSSPTVLYPCDLCGKTYASRKNMRRHRVIHETPSQHTCRLCQKSFLRSDALRRHLKTHEIDVNHPQKQKIAAMSCLEDGEVILRGKGRPLICKKIGNVNDDISMAAAVILMENQEDKRKAAAEAEERKKRLIARQIQNTITLAMKEDKKTKVFEQGEVEVRQRSESNFAMSLEVGGKSKGHSRKRQQEKEIEERLLREEEERYEEAKRLRLEQERIEQLQANSDSDAETSSAAAVIAEMNVNQTSYSHDMLQMIQKQGKSMKSSKRSTCNILKRRSPRTISNN
ncbi:uncharacterized protein LOC141914498 isoform X2 [Tubulanus polymorphus]|uniref:uncharacterized protein LOC141898880 isoform X2 n=1 Tax=Tubulanus polymorphus TaxID=672921 RepID=UPI003DA2E0E0